MNGTKLGDNTLRVFPCLEDTLDYDCSVFVGNLPYDIK